MDPETFGPFKNIDPRTLHRSEYTIKVHENGTRLAVRYDPRENGVELGSIIVPEVDHGFGRKVLRSLVAWAGRKSTSYSYLTVVTKLASWPNDRFKRSIGWVRGPDTRKGHGSKAMLSFVAWVDGYGMDYSCLTAVKQLKRWPVKRLKKFYRFYGFVDEDPRDGYMERLRSSETCD